MKSYTYSEIFKRPLPKRYTRYRNEVAFPNCGVREYHDIDLGLIVDRDINAALNIKQRGLQVFLAPKKASKREGIRITRDLDDSTVTAMIATLRNCDQAHTISLA